MIFLFEQEEAVRRYGKRCAAEEKLSVYADLVADGTLTIEKASEKLGMAVKAFQEAILAKSATE